MRLSNFLIPLRLSFPQDAVCSAQSETGRETRERRGCLFHSPKAPESSSSGSSSLLSSSPLIPSTLTVTEPERQSVSKTSRKKKKNSDKPSEERERSEQSERDREIERECQFTGVLVAIAKTRSPLCPWTVPGPAFKCSTSDFVIDVGWALGRHLLNYVDRVSIVPTDLLVVRAEDAVSSPEGNDDVAGL